MDYLQYKNELRHFSLFGNKKTKYIAKVPTSKRGEYRYFYDKGEYQAYLDAKKAGDKRNIFQKAKDGLMDIVSAPKRALDFVKGEGVYDTHSGNYDRKKAEIMKTKEWRDIVKRKDPEYTRYNQKTGKLEYDFDKYLMNKKHPMMDALYDLDAGRKISLLDQNAETFLAGAKDYIRMGIKSAQFMLQVGVGFLTYRLKKTQGTSNEDIVRGFGGGELIDKGREYVETATVLADSTSKSVKTAREAYDKSGMKKAVETYNGLDESTKAQAKKTMKNIATGKLTSNDIKFISSVGVSTYAAYAGISEETAKRKLVDAASSVVENSGADPATKLAAKQLIKQYAGDTSKNTKITSSTVSNNIDRANPAYNSGKRLTDGKGNADDIKALTKAVTNKDISSQVDYADKVVKSAKNVEKNGGNAEDVRTLVDASVKAYSKATNQSEKETRQKIANTAKNLDDANGNVTKLTRTVIQEYAAANGMSYEEAKKVLTDKAVNSFISQMVRR